ncbi:MAG: hypothetical protein WCE21_01410 [Candidatus Babeliales bacterium]
MNCFFSVRYALALMCIQSSCAMEITQQDADDSQYVIQGILVIQGHESLMYSPFMQKSIHRLLSIEMEPNDPLVSVHGLIKTNSSVCDLYLPDFEQFPQLLPLSLLKDKKEGELLVFSVDNKKIELTCNQKAMGTSVSFEVRLANQIKLFKQKPNWHLFDEGWLLEKGIIEKVRKGEYRHGPNGYTFE